MTEAQFELMLGAFREQHNELRATKLRGKAGHCYPAPPHCHPFATVPKSHAKSATPKLPTTRGSRPRRLEGSRRRISEPASDVCPPTAMARDHSP
jgi:hypothetical protein